MDMKIANYLVLALEIATGLNRFSLIKKIVDSLYNHLIPYFSMAMQPHLLMQLLDTILIYRLRSETIVLIRDRLDWTISQSRAILLSWRGWLAASSLCATALWRGLERLIVVLHRFYLQN